MKRKRLKALRVATQEPGSIVEHENDYVEYKSLRKGVFNIGENITNINSDTVKITAGAASIFLRRLFIFITKFSQQNYRLTF